MALVIMCILSDIDIYMMYMMYVCTAEAISIETRNGEWFGTSEYGTGTWRMCNYWLRMSAGSASEIWPGIASLRE